MDLFTELGGLHSAAGAIVSSYAAWFTIKYFWDLAEVIKGKRQIDCKKALIAIQKQKLVYLTDRLSNSNKKRSLRQFIEELKVQIYAN